MISRPQQEMFDKIANGKLTAKQKGDFYYRMSKVLQKKLDELEAISFLLDAIPHTYQNKINLMKPAMQAMDITEKLVKRLDPAYPSPIVKDSKGNECDIHEAPPDGEEWDFVGRRVIRYFNIDMKSYLPGISGACATIKTSYEPMDEEVAFLHRLTGHQRRIEAIREDSSHPHRDYSHKEFKDVILPALSKRGKNFSAKSVSIIGDYVRDTTLEETRREFTKTEEVLGIR